MRITTLGLLLLLLPAACPAGDDIWATLFREKLTEAAAGNSHAQYDVGTMYQNGRGVAADRDKAIEWYRRAAAQDNPQAVSRLKLIQANEQRFRNALVLAGEGDAESRYTLGKMYMEGIGVQADPAQAASWYAKAAEQGHEKAAFRLGLLHYEGTGVKADLATAFGLFTQAARQGYPAAQFYLGRMYAAGQGVKRDYPAALEWFDKAVEGGFDEARRQVLDVSERMKAAPAAAAADSVAPSPGAAQGETPGYGYQELMLSAWMRDGGPVPYLPSAITACEMEAERLVCTSNEQLRELPAGMIRYKTKAIISKLPDDGAFEVTYRNLVLDANRDTAPETGAGGEEPLGSTTGNPVPANYRVRTGWGKEHTLECRIGDTGEMSCLKDATHTFILENPQTLAAGHR